MNKETYDLLMEMKNRKGIYFNMAVSDLMEKGWKTYENVTSYDIEQAYEREREKEIEDEKEGKYPMFSANFSRQLAYIEAEIAHKVTPVEMIQFLQKNHIFEDYKERRRK